MRKSSSSLNEDGNASIRRRRRSSRLRFSESINYPKAVFFIVGNEFCERFTYYGVTTILALYLKSELGFSDTTATVIYHVFVMFCYFFPLMGAIIADNWLGKYRTILFLSIVYASGDSVLTISAIPGVPAVPLTMIGLIMISTGAGCIKPCVAAFGGDQFVLPEQETHLKKFFSIFYFTINAGSFIASVLTPILRRMNCLGRRTCYSLAFGAPTTAMFVSIVIFVGGTKFYKKKKPEGNVIWRVMRCIVHAIRKRDKSGGHWLDKAADKYDIDFINDVKAALRVLVLFIPLPFFWALFDQQGSRWTFQAIRMNGDIGAMKINADQMQVINPILILLLIPLFEAFVYPSFGRYNLLKKPLQRLTCGGLLAALAFVVSALVEYKLEETYAILPQENEAQIRVYNGLTENLNLTFIDPNYEPVVLESMGYWRKFDVYAKGDATVKVKYSVKGTEKTENLRVTEKALTSYIITPESLVQIPNDDMDKTGEGDPKIMVIYSVPSKQVTVSVFNCKRNYDFILTKQKPYSEYSEVRECNKNRISVDGKVIQDDLKIKQGGVYVLFLVESGGSVKLKLLNVIQPNTVHMLWLIPQYVIITAAEVMFSITGLEFSFTQAPVSMKALLQAAWLMTVAIGNSIVAIIAQARIFERQLYEFLLFAALMTLDMFIFALMAMRYKYVEPKEPDPEELEAADKREDRREDRREERRRRLDRDR